ncbi:FtsX-like permease family protein [Gloeocapsopsis crepidinum LEGE 06123]|uniref:FtsX-like permease family protein n=1 Tax=Gloeocapsopsis crepidinum LEGE 06123 TaxID=588587 RepID=A0ABR9UUR3_9CHRO|nr:ABC transporter permease DevC [Gloeocapsopsis crepidinum]MBE9191320.1 FtsX-like permease family protein [Gloeocapsopsis crepidinum LEGE 06123]
MKRKTPLAWLQVSRERTRLLIAMAGIAFADMLMFLQMGFQDALYDSNTRMHRSMRADLVLVSPQAQNIVNLSTFPRSRLYQTMNFAGVESAVPLYAETANWKVPQTRLNSAVLVLAFNPEKSAFSLSGVEQNLDRIKLPDTFLFDSGSRGEYDQTIAQLKQAQSIFTEFSDRKIEIDGLFNVGASFAADGNLITSDLNFLRIFPQRTAAEVSVGLVTLKPGSDPQQVAAVLKAGLSNDVQVLTHEEFVETEKTYWANNTPIGFIFSLGTAIGFVVGVVIVYQILYSDVSDHLSEYATLKAMGYKDIYLLGVVFQEAIILAILGFIPGYTISVGLYGLTRSATNLPLFMTLVRAISVFCLTIIMCLASGLIAMRKLRAADPADIF